METDNFLAMQRQKADYDKTREERYRADSKGRLLKIFRKKIETTMIGALSSIENNLGHLWNAAGGGPTNPEQQAYFDIYQKIRSEILDKGNTQARNVDAELNQYDIKWLRYQMTIPVKPMEPRPMGRPLSDQS